VAQHVRAMCQWSIGSALPRDVMQITPCFRVQEDFSPGGTGWTDLADDLADGLQVWEGATKRQLTVKLYQIGEPKPNRPKATAVRDVGVFTESACPRELAVCLSFYGGQNAPHQRGRLYTPPTFYTSGALPVRPTAPWRARVAELVPLFAGLGGINVDWIVWSPTRSLATKVDHWWVDDEWDVQRRRGLKPAARDAGTTGG
jgi:hypothetical protein